MKKIISLLALAGLALTGCVDDNPSVILNGFVHGECSPSGGDQNMWAGAICDPSLRSNSVSLHFNNYITGEPPWSSSGGGSGTTFEPDIPNPGMIFLDSVTIKCYSIDGDVNACQDVEPIVWYSTTPLFGNGSGLCYSIQPDIATIASWGSNVIVDIYGEYHDSSLIKGQTSHIKFSFQFQGNGASCFFVPPEVSGEETPNE